MKKITSFRNLSKHEFQQLRDEMNKELKALGEKLGVVFSAHGITLLLCWLES